MATLRNNRKLEAVSRQSPENTRIIQSQNTLGRGMAQKYISHFSEEIEGRVTKKLSKEFSRTVSRFLGVLCKLDEFLLNPQVWICSASVPVKSRNEDSKNPEEPIGDCSLRDPCPEALFSTYQSNNLNDSEQEETHHFHLSCYLLHCRLLCQTLVLMKNRRKVNIWRKNAGTVFSF